MNKFLLVKENHFWLPHREVEQLIFDFFDGNGAYTQGFIKSNKEGTYTLSVTSDPAYEDFETEPFTGTCAEVMEEVSNYFIDDLDETLFNFFYLVGDVEAVKLIIADRVGYDIDSDFMRTALGQQFFESHSFVCEDYLQFDIECEMACLKREKVKFDTLSLDDFEEELFKLND